MSKKQDEVALNSADVKFIKHLIDCYQRASLDNNPNVCVISANRLVKYLNAVFGTEKQIKEYQQIEKRIRQLQSDVDNTSHLVTRVTAISKKNLKRAHAVVKNKRDAATIDHYWQIYRNNKACLKEYVEQQVNNKALLKSSIQLRSKLQKSMMEGE